MPELKRRCQPLYSSVVSFPSIHNGGMRKASELLRVQHEQAVCVLSMSKPSLLSLMFECDSTAAKTLCATTCRQVSGGLST